MKPLYNPLIHIFLALILGVIMIVFPQQSLHYISLLLGVALLIPGAIDVLRYVIEHSAKSRRNRRNSTLRFPIIALLSVVAGVAILCFPGTVAKILIYVLGACLVLAGIYEIAFLSLLHRRVRAGYYILPIAILLTGIFLLVNPLSVTKSMIVMTFGFAAVVYAVSELIYYIKFKR